MKAKAIGLLLAGAVVASAAWLLLGSGKTDGTDE